MWSKAVEKREGAHTSTPSFVIVHLSAYNLIDDHYECIFTDVSSMFLSHKTFCLTQKIGWLHQSERMKEKKTATSKLCEFRIKSSIT